MSDLQQTIPKEQSRDWGNDYLPTPLYMLQEGKAQLQDKTQNKLNAVAQTGKLEAIRSKDTLYSSAKASTQPG